jgi:DNA modification methylase
MSDIESRLFEKDLFGDVQRPRTSGPLAERFLVPPFSVLNAREGAWKERKRAWLAIGLEGEVSAETREHVWNKSDDEEVRAIDYDYEGGQDAWGGAGVSVFDPVLCELVYRWFCPLHGAVIDPFAGGSVRGVVASYMGRDYWGCDLRPEQIAANEKQATQLCDETVKRPVWVCGDSHVTLEDAPFGVDLVFTCPPYGDLEIYSERDGDLSNMQWKDFTSAYIEIIRKATVRLALNRFAVFVVGDFRDQKTHAYRNFPALTCFAFRKANLELHNEAVLVTSVGSLPVRSAKAFEVSRKLGKTHQNVLVFVKGDPIKAARACESTLPPPP